MVGASERTLANSPFRKATCQSGRESYRGTPQGGVRGTLASTATPHASGGAERYPATAGRRGGGVRGTLPREIHLYVVLDSVRDAHVHSPPPPKLDRPYAQGMIPG